jgi:Monooxygenase af470-like
VSAGWLTVAQTSPAGGILPLKLPLKVISGCPWSRSSCGAESQLHGGRLGLRRRGRLHETFKVRSGEYEAIYANMPVFGLAAAAGHLPTARKANTAAVRIGASTMDEPAIEPY